MQRLEKGIAVGLLIVVSSAIRDEGASYHYLPPIREVIANPLSVATLETAVKQKGWPYIVGKTWTTDAPYRETASKVALRKNEGCLTVEMEAASFIAVAEFRKVVLVRCFMGATTLGATNGVIVTGYHNRMCVKICFGFPLKLV